MAKPYRPLEAQILCKVEAVAGTAEVLVSNDMIQASNVKLTPGFEFTPNEALTSVPDHEPGVSGKRTAEFSFDIILKGSGTAGTAPEFRDAIMSAGLSETIVGGTSVTYKLAAPESYYTYGMLCPGLGAAGEDILFRIAGCQANLKLTFKAGGLLMANIAAKGVWVAPSDTTALAVPTWDTSIPYAFLGAGATFQGTSGLAFETFDMDLGNNIDVRPNANSASGCLTAQIGARRLTGSVDFEQEKIATFDLYTKIGANTTGAFAMTPVGVAGNLTALAMPKFAFTGVDQGVRANALLSTAKYEAYRSTNAGLDSFSLIFT